MDHVVLGNGVGGQPFGDLYAVTFSWMRIFQLVSLFASFVDFPYLVRQPEVDETGC